MTAQHRMRGDVAVLVPAAGLGTRLGPGAPKALRELAGASLLSHAVRRLCAAPSVGCLVVAAPPDSVDEVRTALGAVVPRDVVLRVIVGGRTRQASVYAALRATPAEFPLILIHDAARALAPPELVERVAATVRQGHDAVIPVLPVVDTVKRIDQAGYVIETPQRSLLRAVQTPQGFRRAVIEAAHVGALGADEDGVGATDDAGLVERIGVRVFCVAGAEAAVKITHPDDLTRAERLLAAELSPTANSGWAMTDHS